MRPPDGAGHIAPSGPAACLAPPENTLCGETSGRAATPGSSRPRSPPCRTHRLSRHRRAASATSPAACTQACPDLYQGIMQTRKMTTTTTMCASCPHPREKMTTTTMMMTAYCCLGGIESSQNRLALIRGPADSMMERNLTMKKTTTTQRSSFARGIDRDGTNPIDAYARLPTIIEQKTCRTWSDLICLYVSARKQRNRRRCTAPAPCNGSVHPQNLR
mmetsp:Transcript_10519/g.14658  ORF Transcript_10519/g.14658 Transcript_10519/m.14658 type:complete len:218 (+) Transcript_10519:286-939(+)